MATSGSTKIAIYESWLHLEFIWQQNSQSVGDNTTTIGWKMNLIAGNGSIIKSDRTWKVVIDGVTYTGKNKVNISSNSTQTLASGTAVVTHSDDGTKSFAYSFSQEFKLTLNNGNYMGTYSGAGSGTLETIARASQPSLVTWPETTQNVGDFGVQFSIHMNRNASTFTHTVRYEYGSRSGTIATGVETGTTWAVPLSFINDIPNATSGSGRIYVDTYNGTTLIGTKYTGFTATVPASVKPTCSLTLEDTTGIDDIYGSPVQGLSKIKITVGTQTAYGSPIASYAVSANGASYTSATSTTDVLKTSGSSPITATVKDKRGRSGTASYTMSVLAYLPPIIEAVTVHRCDADGAENDKGDYIRVSFSARVTSLSGKNTATYTLKYKKSEATSYTTQTLTSYANTYVVTNGSVIIAADGNSSYDAELTVTDRHKTTSRSTSASTAFTLMNWGPDGTSMAFGKVAEESGTLEVALDNHFYGRTRLEGNRYAASSTGTSGTSGYIRMVRVQYAAGGTYADSPLTFVFTRREAPTPMTVHLLLSGSAASLGSIRYEGTNYDAYAHLPDSSTCDIYVRKTYGTDQITLQDWYTSQRNDSRVRVTFPGTQVSTVPTPYYKATPAMLDSLIDFIYPVNSIYLSYSHVDPGTLFGGTWERLKEAFLWAVGAGGSIGKTGGEATHTLTVAEMPAHQHGIAWTDSDGVITGAATQENPLIRYGTSGTGYRGILTVATGGGAAHNNMPPYIQISAWRRTA